MKSIAERIDDAPIEVCFARASSWRGPPLIRRLGWCLRFADNGVSGDPAENGASRRSGRLPPGTPTLQDHTGDFSNLDDGGIGHDHSRCQTGPNQLGSKRKTVTLWTCCVCGYGGMPVSVAACQHCANPRCPYCLVERVKTKPCDIWGLGPADTERQQGDGAAGTTEDDGSGIGLVAFALL
ncbi:hypothetical protein HJFPF1_04065 [Paramyrothecium foliicola]|nr:hypothetical protein HJFPF1_04065 [Paramyrothecium foliicola]